MKGTYVLIVELAVAKTLRFGKHREFRFEKGYYAYTGSALSGLEQRLARHLRAEKKTFWHIDSLLADAAVRTVIYAESSRRRECAIAAALSESFSPVPGFGCGDCCCPSHLFFSEDRDSLTGAVLDAFRTFGLSPAALPLP